MTELSYNLDESIQAIEAMGSQLEIPGLGQVERIFQEPAQMIDKVQFEEMLHHLFHGRAQTATFLIGDHDWEVHYTKENGHYNAQPLSFQEGKQLSFDSSSDLANRILEQAEQAVPIRILHTSPSLQNSSVPEPLEQLLERYSEPSPHFKITHFGEVKATLSTLREELESAMFLRLSQRLQELPEGQQINLVLGRTQESVSVEKLHGLYRIREITPALGTEPAEMILQETAETIVQRSQGILTEKTVDVSKKLSLEHISTQAAGHETDFSGSVSHTRVVASAPKLIAPALTETELIDILKYMTPNLHQMEVQNDEFDYRIRKIDDGAPKYEISYKTENREYVSYGQALPSEQDVAQLLGSHGPIRIFSFENQDDLADVVVNQQKVQRIRTVIDRLGPDQTVQFSYRSGRSLEVKRTHEVYVARQPFSGNSIVSIGAAESVAATLVAVELGPMLIRNMEQWTYPIEHLSLKEVLMHESGVPRGGIAGKLEEAVQKYRMHSSGKLEYVLKGQSQIQTLDLQPAPYLSPNVKSRMLDVAGGTITPVQPTQGHIIT